MAQAGADPEPGEIDPEPAPLNPPNLAAVNPVEEARRQQAEALQATLLEAMTRSASVTGMPGS